MTSMNNFIKSITSSFPDELSPLPEIQSTATETTSSTTGFLSNVTWQTWIKYFYLFSKRYTSNCYSIRTIFCSNSKTFWF